MHVRRTVFALVRGLERVSTVSGVVAALLILPLVLVTCAEVFSRYVLGSSTAWGFELGYMGMGAHFLLGAAYTLKIRGHIRIDILYGYYPERLKAALDLAGYLLLILPFCIWLSMGLWEHMREAYEWGETTGASGWNPIVWPFRLILVTGFALLAVQICAEILRCLLVLFGGASTLDDNQPLEAKAKEV